MSEEAYSYIERAPLSTTGKVCMLAVMWLGISIGVYLSSKPQHWLAATVFLLVFSLTVLLAWFFWSARFVADISGVNANFGPFKVKVPLSRIKDMKVVSEPPVGFCRIKLFGKHKAIVTTLKPCVKIYYNSKTLLISVSEPERFISTLQKLMSRYQRSR
jgi:hypothetical protein